VASSAPSSARSGQDDTHILQALEAIPGTLIGIAIVYFEGVRRGNEALEL
jgi:hypothetical protein